MWNNKFMAWIEQKLIDLTSTVYLKRREIQPVVELVAPTMEPATPAKTRTLVKRTEPSKPLVKSKAAKPKAKPAAKAPAKKAPAKAPVKKAAPKAAPKAKAKPAAIKAKTKAKAK